MKYYLEDEYKDSCKCGNPKHGHNQNDRQQRQPIKERPVTLQARQPLVAVPPRYLNVYGNTANAQPTRMGYYAGQNTQFPYEEVREPIREPVMFAAPPRYPTTFPTKFPHEEVCHSVHEPVLMATPPPKHHINIQTSCCDQPEDIYHKKHVSTLKREAAVEVPPKESISKKCSLNRDKEVLGGQFPCPCLTTDTKCCGNESKWDEQFYKWWGWNWLKGRENELRMQMTREGKRFSEEFPILMSRAFTEEQRRRNLPEDYPEELLKQEVYETFQQAPINQNLYVGRPDKPIRKPGWIRAINSVFRTITCRERKSLEDTRICDCGAKLKICGPHDKPCGGMDATVIPCGFDCDCNHDKSCLEPYLYDLCPCAKPCTCPRPSKMLKPKDIVEWSERHRLYTPGPMQQLSMQQPPIDQPQQYPQLYSQQLPERQIPTQTSVQYLPTNHMSMQTYFHEPAEHELSRIPRHEAIVLHKAPPPAEAGYTSDNCCNYPRKTEIVHLRTSGTSQRTQKPDSTDSDECCCSCDEEPCDCNCCCCLDVSKKGIQTSQFCFRENCTQTDKVKRKRRCCRCCRCCMSRGMRNCAKCANEGTECGGRTGHDGGGPPHRGGGPPHGGGGPPHGGGGPPHGGGGPPHGGSPSGGGHSGGARPPSGGEHRGAHDRQTNRSFATNTSHHQTQHQHHVHYHAESRSSKTIHHNSPHSNTKPNHNPPHPQSRKKTIMVRTNSVQCIPVQENKSTTCNHDDRISMTRLDKFLSQLRGSKTRTDVDVKNEIDSTAKDSGDFKKPAIQLNTKDITALTKAKLRNYFLEGDVYMSPVSGRNYDLSYRNIEVPSQIVNTNTKLLKPLDINEQLQYAKLPTECFTSETEHTKLMTAICEAVLSSTGRQNELEVPTKETKEINTPNTSPPTSPHADTLHTISEDNESVNSIRNTAAINVASTIKPSYKDESESINLRSEEMCEVQRNFKDKIEKLEGKIQELMSKTQTNTENKAIPKERSRSPRPHLHQTKQNQKTINEHKPFVTKTGLFGAMPTRSQLFAGNVSKKAHPANAHQHGDDVADNNKKIQDDSIVKYENLVADNQRHVDDLLGQLEVLRNGNDKKDVKKDDICCLEPTGSMLYNPDMGTGEIFTAKLKNQNKNENTPSKELFNQLEHLFTDNARGETVFYVNEIHYDDLGPSTSASVKDNTDIIYESADASSEQQKPLDFSSIVFTSSSGIVPNSGEKDMGNFILENLPSYSTSISDSYIVEQMLRQDQSVYGSSNSILSEVDNLNISLPNTCNTSVCDDVNSKSKVQ